MAPLLATPGMASLSVALFAMQLLSLLIMGGIVYEFREIERRHILLHQAIGHSSAVGRGNILLWFYIILTLCLVSGTGALFILQPHIF